MAISLKVQPYCENCSNFEPDSYRIGGASPSGSTVSETVVFCEHWKECEGIFKYLVSCAESKGESNNGN